MADFKEGQGVQTHRDNDFGSKIVDGQSGDTATDKLTVAQPTDTVVADTNDYGIPILFKKEDGTYCIPQTDDNCSLKVVVVADEDDDDKHSFKTASAIAAAGTDDHDLVVTSGKKVKKIKLTLASFGCFKYEIGEWDGTATFDVRATLITQPAMSSICCEVCVPEITGDGSIAVRIKVTNEDDNANDAYSTMCFTEFE